MANLRAILLSLTLCASLAAEAGATTAFIAEGAPAELRSGVLKKDRTIMTVDPGTRLTILKQNSKSGFVQVRLDSGQTGWLPARMISKQAPVITAPPPVQVTTPEAPQKSAQQLQSEVNHLQTELLAVRQASSNILRIQAERDQLQETVISQKKELESALRDKHALNDDQKQQWFLTGAAVLLSGIVIGVILPRLSVRRRNDWSSF